MACCITKACKIIKKLCPSTPINPSPHFSISFNFNFTNRIDIEQRAEGGGQINKNVGSNANQGGQIAIKGRTANIKSQFANGNGRSGNAGDCNSEVTDSDIIGSKPNPCCKPISCCKPYPCCQSAPCCRTSSVVVLKKSCCCY